MKLEEKELEDIIMNTPNHVLMDKGLSIYGDKQRQINLGSYGILDVLTSKYDDVINFSESRYSGENLCLQLFELKSGKISINTFFQAIRYVKGIKRHLPNMDFIFEIILIGTSIDTSGDFVFLPDVLNSFLDFEDKKIYSQVFSGIHLYTIHYDINGLSFKYHDDYLLTNESLNKKLLIE